MTSSQCVVCKQEVTEPFLSDARDYQYGGAKLSQIGRCSGCGLVQQMPMLTQEEALALYPDHYAQYNPGTGALRRKLLGVYFRSTVDILRKLDAAPGKKLLDIGSGAGEKASYLRDALGLDVTCVEPHEGAAQAAREAWGLEVIDSFFPCAEVKPGSFDFIYINHVIEHCPDPVSLLSDIHAALKPGGWIIGETENIDSISYKLFGRYWSLLHTPYHLYFFTPESLKRVFSESKFGEMSYSYMWDPSAWVLSLHNWTKRNKAPGEITDKPIPGYMFLLMCAVPFALLETRRGPILRFWAQA